MPLKYDLCSRRSRSRCQRDIVRSSCAGLHLGQALGSRWGIAGQSFTGRVERDLLQLFHRALGQRIKGANALDLIPQPLDAHRLHRRWADRCPGCLRAG